MEWKDKKIMVVGMARSGIGASVLLCKLGAVPLLVDQKPRDAFNGKLDVLEAYFVKWHLGEDPQTLLSQVDGVIISPGVPADASFIKQAKEKNIPVLGEMEFASQLTKGTLIAVTGTNGKTTTVSLLGEVFKNAGKKTYVTGNIGFPLSLVANETREEDVVIAEISSFQLETVKTLHPNISVILNITPDHLDRHGTMENYTALKKRIYQNQTKKDAVVLNLDDPNTKELKKEINQPDVFWFSAKEKVKNGAFVDEGKIIFALQGEVRSVCSVEDILIPGEHNLQNALAAVTVAMIEEIPAPVIRHSLRTFAGVEHRIERVREHEGITYINDSKGTNIESTLKAIEAMKGETVIILGGYDKKVDFAPLAQEMLKAPQIIRAILIGETADKIEEALQEAGFKAFIRSKTLKEAVYKGREMTPKGGNLLLSPACASFDMFTDYEERGRAFKKIVEEMV